MSKKCKFHKEWLTKHDWLEEIPQDEGKAKCKLCNSNIDLGTRGYANIKQHQERQTHKSNENAASKTVAIDQMMKSEFTHNLTSYMFSHYFSQFLHL